MFGGRITGKSWKDKTILGTKTVYSTKIIVIPDAPFHLILDLLAPIRLNGGKALNFILVHEMLNASIVSAT